MKSIQEIERGHLHADTIAMLDFSLIHTKMISYFIDAYCFGQIHHENTYFELNFMGFFPNMNVSILLSIA